MAPPTPVFSGNDISRDLRLDKLISKSDCVLKSLTQFECSFDGGLVNCVPFKRLFKDCTTKTGSKQRVEITNELTNSDGDQRYDELGDLDELKAFLNANEKLRNASTEQQKGP